MRDEQFHIVSAVAGDDETATVVAETVDDGLTVVRDLNTGYCYIAEIPEEW